MTKNPTITIKTQATTTFDALALESIDDAPKHQESVDPGATRRLIEAFALEDSEWGRTILDAVAQGGRFDPDDKRRSGSWVTCACGKQDPRIPRDSTGEPRDRQLSSWGQDFYDEGVMPDDPFRAAVCLVRVEHRAGEVLASLAPAERRVLRVEPRGLTDSGRVKVYITEQSHRGAAFTPNGRKWTAPNGVCLESSGMPERWSSHLLFVRGNAGDQDDAPMRVPPGDLARLLEAVDAYNEAFGGDTP